MKTKSKAVEELDELIEQLAQIEDITSEINKLKNKYNEGDREYH